MSYFRSIDHVGPPDINVVEGDDVLRGLGETEVCYESNIDAAWEPARQPPAPAACECIESLHGSQTFIVGYQALLEQEPPLGAIDLRRIRSREPTKSELCPFAGVVLTWGVPTSR